MIRTLASLAAAALLTGCITIDTLGARRQPLTETVIYGERGPKAVMIDIDGLISEEEVAGPLGIGGSEATVARLREQLEKAGDDKQVEGLLLRINSPGGTVTASDILHREIQRFKKEHEIPVVAQMMGVAASGGYYVAMAADAVYAHPTTITGSIGVISAGVNVSGLMERFGVSDQTLTSGAFKDAGSPLRPMTTREEAYLQAVLDDLHERFRAVVDDGRPSLDRAGVDALSDGRIFTAGQARENGLVDGIRYLPEAVDELAARMGSEEIRVVSYHRRQEWRSTLYSRSGEPPRAEPTLAQRLGLDRSPGFFYLWWPGLAPR